MNKIQFIFAVFLVILLSLIINQWMECSGTFVRTLFWYKCI